MENTQVFMTFRDVRIPGGVEELQLCRISHFAVGGRPFGRAFPTEPVR